MKSNKSNCVSNSNESNCELQSKEPTCDSIELQSKELNYDSIESIIFSAFQSNCNLKSNKMNHQLNSNKSSCDSIESTILSVFNHVYHITGYEISDIGLDKSDTIPNNFFKMDNHRNTIYSLGHWWIQVYNLYLIFLSLLDPATILDFALSPFLI